MAKWKFEGLDDYVLKIEAIDKNSESVLGRAVFDGAKLVADACKEGVRNIPVDDAYYDDGRPHESKGESKDNEKRTYTEVVHGTMRKGIRTNERTDLVDSFGITKLRNDDGYFNVKCGFDGKNRYGTPNLVIARACESGTSFLPKFGTLAKATRGLKKRCEGVMNERLNQELEKLMK